MDAAGDEQAVDAGGVGAGYVGAKAVADAQDAAAILDPEKPEATVVDRRVGLAVIGDRASEPFVVGGQRAGADRHGSADHDPEGRVRANPGKPAPRPGNPDRGVVRLRPGAAATTEEGDG